MDLAEDGLFGEADLDLRSDVLGVVFVEDAGAIGGVDSFVDVGVLALSIDCGVVDVLAGDGVLLDLRADCGVVLLGPTLRFSLLA